MKLRLRLAGCQSTTELYLPALLGGLEQVSAFRETAGGDSRRGGFAAPAEAEPTTRRRRWRNTWRKKYGGWLKYGPDKVRRGTALDDLSAFSFQLAESARGAVPLASSWRGARAVASRGLTMLREPHDRVDGGGCKEGWHCLTSRQ